MHKAMVPLLQHGLFTRLIVNTGTWQEIGEEFVEFLEKELNITDSEAIENNDKKSSYSTKSTANADPKDTDKGGANINDNIDEIEATLAQLKKELGL